MTDTPAAVDGRTLRHLRAREDLLHSVLSVMMTSTAFGSSLRAIAADIGVSHTLLVHHFGSRENLLVEVITALRMKQLDGVSEANDLHEFWRAVSAEANIDYFRLFFGLYGQALAEPSRFPDFIEHVVSDWINLLSGRLHARPGLNAKSPAVATLIIATVRGLLLDLLTTGDRERIDTAFDDFAALLDNC